MRRLTALAVVLVTSLVVSRCSVVACGCVPPPLDTGVAYVLEPAPPPVLVGADSLAATVSYGGGCSVHTFRAVGAGVEAGAVRVALVHEADRPDPCRAYITERVRVRLPERRADRPGVVLVGPDGSRWPVGR